MFIMNLDYADLGATIPCVLLSILLLTQDGPVLVTTDFLLKSSNIQQKNQC